MNKLKKQAKKRTANRNIKMITRTFALNGDTYFVDRESTRMIDEETYRNILGARRTMEHLGGKERQYRGYDTEGNLMVTKIISTSPDKTTKVYRYFIK